MLTTKFMITGSSVSVIQLNEDTVLDQLPPQIYTLQLNPLTGFYLSITKDQLQLPEKIYGSAHKRVAKCITTYTSRETSTGILLTGDKGTGKTLVMSLLANDVITQLKLPVILIKEPHGGEQFCSFIETLGECCLVFDEFGKMYEREDSDGVSQQDLLSLMDGVDKTKRMIVLTENHEFNINEFMLNRPSRIFYHFRYAKLDEDSITGYCQDFNGLISDEFITSLIDLSRRSLIFSFDMMQSIVEEHLRFGEGLETIIDELNIQITEEYQANIEITKVVRKVDGSEGVVCGPHIVSKPTRYDSTKLKIYVDDPTRTSEKTNVRSSKALSEHDDVDISVVEDVADVYSIYVKCDQIVYEKKNQLVYETDTHTIIATELPMMMMNYNKYLV
jgi:hypothetical protein